LEIKININVYLREGKKIWVDSVGLGYDPVAGSGEHGNETLGSVISEGISWPAEELGFSRQTLHSGGHL
jgi:hypothetical protein